MPQSAGALPVAAATAPLLLYPMPGNAARAQAMADALPPRQAVRLMACEVHTFPDGETLVRVQPPDPGGIAVLVCTLNDPDPRTVPLLMAAATLRELGAAQVGLVAPYLAYMRQDMRFAPGQTVSARVYARLLSAHLDWLLTVDPHLHRIHDLGEIYTLRSRVLHAAPRLAEWIAAHVPAPLIIGPDGESAQWAADVAARVDAPVIVVQKTRLGDTDVRSTIPDLHRYPGRTPVLLDDIISTGRTLVAALDHLRAEAATTPPPGRPKAGCAPLGGSAGEAAAWGHTTPPPGRPKAGCAPLGGSVGEAAAWGHTTPPPVCVAVHGLFAGDALQALRAAGAARIAVADTVSGVEAPGVDVISLDADLAAAVLELTAGGDGAPAQGVRP
ncbi:ribose-phosphate diphosphokinase [Thiomonas sp.]|uniref:ribose-phosphate diphosphokinase n=1 Tax=Thiomonas sp. TaxID=2047785 RepID=UPI00262C9A19|nr:ribose-phosphate diphosphokinase [Thiomonas sp.]